MTEHQITCANKSGEHSHIVSVGTSDGTNLTVKAVRRAIKAGNRFYTVSPSTGAETDVRRWRCLLCQKGTIRSNPDQVTDNNVDNLDPC